MLDALPLLTDYKLYLALRFVDTKKLFSSSRRIIRFVSGT